MNNGMSGCARECFIFGNVDVFMPVIFKAYGYLRIPYIKRERFRVALAIQISDYIFRGFTKKCEEPRRN